MSHKCINNGGFCKNIKSILAQRAYLRNKSNCGTESVRYMRYKRYMYTCKACLQHSSTFRKGEVMNKPMN